MKKLKMACIMLVALSSFSMTTPVSAARRDSATDAFLANVDKGQATLVSIRQLIDGIEARKQRPSP